MIFFVLKWSREDDRLYFTFRVELMIGWIVPRIWFVADLSRSFPTLGTIDLWENIFAKISEAFLDLCPFALMNGSLSARYVRYIHQSRALKVWRRNQEQPSHWGSTLPELLVAWSLLPQKQKIDIELSSRQLWILDIKFTILLNKLSLKRSSKLPVAARRVQNIILAWTQTSNQLKPPIHRKRWYTLHPRSNANLVLIRGAFWHFTQEFHEIDTSIPRSCLQPLDITRSTYNVVIFVHHIGLKTVRECKQDNRDSFRKPEESRIQRCWGAPVLAFLVAEVGTLEFPLI